MTDIRIQRLELGDCEDSIVRNYYDWGRERSREGWVDPAWDEASEEQREIIAMRGYALYDGCPVPLGDEITSAEIWATAGFRSRIIELDAIRILSRADRAVPLLAQIPENLSLDKASDEHMAVAGKLISCLSGYQVRLAKVTKMLHKKRPAFMPVLDSVVVDCLSKNFPHLIKKSSTPESFLKLCQMILTTYLPLIEKVRDDLSTTYPLSNVRVLDWLLWIGWRDHVDEYGFGRRITEVWETTSVADARAKARELWKPGSHLDGG